MPKFLVIRFSSIGDIVLTTPIVRCLKNQVGDCEIHFVTKNQYRAILDANPHIDKVYVFSKSVREVSPYLKKEKYDHVIDLHRNLRSWRLKKILGVNHSTFDKLNVKKYIATNFKVNNLPEIHIVDRYFQAVNSLEVKNDQKGLDFFIDSEDQVVLEDFGIKGKFLVYAIGGQFNTKKLPRLKIKELIHKIPYDVVLIGGKEDESIGLDIEISCSNVTSLCGQLSIAQSASIIDQADAVITHDTGMMHIAAAFQKKIISIWGNTIPEFGMFPYMPENESNFDIHEVSLKCRPCSKIGHVECPKGHFNCMNQQDLDAIANSVLQKIAIPEK